MQVEFKLKNPHKLEKAIRVLVKNSEDSLANLIKLGVSEIAREARARAPKKYGNYKKMFKWRAMKTFGWAAPMRRRNKTSAIGHILEFGSVHARPFPHLMPAFHRVEKTMRRRITTAIHKSAKLARFFTT